MCFVFIWEQTATCATHSINWLVFITEMKSVYCAVRTGSLNKAVCASYLKVQERMKVKRYFPPSPPCRHGIRRKKNLYFYTDSSILSHAYIFYSYAKLLTNIHTYTHTGSNMCIQVWWKLICRKDVVSQAAYRKASLFHSAALCNHTVQKI